MQIYHPVRATLGLCREAEKRAGTRPFVQQVYMLGHLDVVSSVSCFGTVSRVSEVMESFEVLIDAGEVEGVC